MSRLDWYSNYSGNGSMKGDVVWKTEAQDYGGSVNIVVEDSDGNRRSTEYLDSTRIEKILAIVDNNSAENMGDITIQSVNGRDANYAILELRLNPPGYAKYTDFVRWLASR